MTEPSKDVLAVAGALVLLLPVIGCASGGSGATSNLDGGTAGGDAGPDAGLCGDGVLEAGEACDDGNGNPGDGCSSTCNLEVGWNCTTPAAGRSTCTPNCGDGMVVGGEVCDDGNTTAGDGCSPSCLVETGWECHGAPSVCTALPPRVRTPPSLGAPITGLPSGQWSYVDFPNTTCANGSPAGLLISPGSQDVVFFMEGGWVCANYGECVAGMSSLVSPDVTQQQSLLDYWNNASNCNGTIFSRSDPDNVFKDFTFLHMLDCTWDLYGGDAVVTYTSGSQSLTVYHKGHANLVAFLDRVAATWTAPERVVVAGSSAGGFGTLFTYDTFRLYWPNQKMYLIDDSGPVMAGIDFFALPQLADAWNLWNVQAALGDICPGCGSDLSGVYAALERWYPNDRKSLLSHLNDPAIEDSGCYGLGDAAFAEALRSTAGTLLEPSRWKWFYGGRGHTFIGGTTISSGTTFVSAGVPLNAFLKAQIDDDPAWSSVTPP
jgi:cysteine-rich repeat protein